MIVHYIKTRFYHNIIYYQLVVNDTCFYLKKPKRKTSPIVNGEEKIYTKYSGDAYFDKFRNKEKLKTKGEQILKKHDRK